jgi:hypothetical protein
LEDQIYQALKEAEQAFPSQVKETEIPTTRYFFQYFISVNLSFIQNLTLLLLNLNKYHQ